MQIIDEDLTPLVRLDFSDDAAWQKVCELAAQNTAEGFMALVQPMEDREIEGRSAEEVTRLFGDDVFGMIIFADAAAMSGDHALLCVNTEDPGQSFRCIPSELWGPENNIRLCNMEFEQFAEAAGPDGVFRGF